MSKNKDKDIVEGIVIETIEELPKIFVEAPKTITFEQWAARKKIKNHHLRGIRAHVIDAERARTFEDWERASKGY